MRINRTTIFISLIAASTLIITSALLVSDISDNVHPVTGDEFTYTLEFSETKNKPTLESDTGNTGSYTVYTDLGNPIQFDYSDVSEFTLGFLGMPAGASFSNPYLEDVANHNQISGIQTISIVSTGDLILYYGYGSEINEGIYFDSLAITSGETIDIDNASYFTLKNEGEVEIGITSISIVYSCFAVDKEMNLDALTFKLNSEETGYIVSDCDTSIFGEVIIPIVYNGLPVLEIGDYAFSSCASLTSINIPSSVTSIGEYAFYGCTSLTSINIPSSITSTGSFAFDRCTSLTIYCEAFSKPSGWPSTWNSFRPVVWNYQGINGVTEDGLKYGVTLDTNNEKCIAIAGYVGEPTDIVIPSSINVGEEELPVKEIIGLAFRNCTSLTSVTFAEKSQLESIGDRAFSSCASLTSINIPSSVTSIGEYAFSSCSSLTSIIIPSSVASIGPGAFSSCSSLASINIPSSVTSIGEYAFSSCSSLTSVTFAENSQLKSIGDRAFYGCSSLASINIPSSVTSIGDRAFYGCSSLTSITFAENSKLLKIGDRAFYGCSSLTSIVIPSRVASIGDRAFDNCSSLTIYCEASSERSGWSSLWNPSFRPVVWNYQGINGVTEDGVKYCVTLGTNGDKYIAIAGYVGEPTDIVIPSSISVGGEELPIKKIISRAFYNCASLTSINIPSSVTSIGSGAFYGCSSLTSVTFAENSQLKSIADSAFSSCPSLTFIIIPSSVTSIGYQAFSSCPSLTSIIIPSSVTSIAGSAFYNCASLTIYCEASSKPSGWDSRWNSSNRPIIWGSLLDGEYVYSTADDDIILIEYLGKSSNPVVPSIVGDNLRVTKIDCPIFSDCIYFEGSVSDWESITKVDPVTYDVVYYSESEPEDTTRFYWHYVDGEPTLWEVV